MQGLRCLIKKRAKLGMSLGLSVGVFLGDGMFVEEESGGEVPFTGETAEFGGAGGSGRG